MHKLWIVCTLAIIGFPNVQLYSQLVTYGWPIWPEEKEVLTGFCAYRPDYYIDGTFVERHFHGGIDIPEGTDPLATVFSITLSFKVIDIGGDFGNQWIKVQHYYDETTSGSLDSGSVYIHLITINPNLEEGGVYTGDWLADGDDLKLNHLHLDYRITSQLTVYKNPFSITELQITDNDSPILCSLYVDYTLLGDAEVACWEYMGSNFPACNTVSGFLQLYLPSESPYNDWDDPHFIISGNRKVRFVMKMFDTDISAPYHYYLSVDTAIVDLAGPSYDSDNYYEVKFDEIYSDEYKKEETVYHQEVPIESGWDSQYYRLYPYGTQLDCVLKWLTLETESFEEGQHRIRITAKDYDGNSKTADAHFYIKKSDWVDYCRSFNQEAN